MNKKILLFLHNFNVGGAEKNIINYANYFKEKNFSVSIICIKNEGILRKNIRKDVKIINLNKKRLLFSIFQIAKIINNLKPDVVISSLHHISLALSIIKSVYKKKFKLFIRPSNIIFNDKINFFIKKKILILLTEIFFRKVDLFFCISDEIYYDLKNLNIPKSKIKKINNAIVDKNFYKKSKEKINDNFYNKKNYILSIGRLTEQKNHILLLKAFKKVIKKYSNIHLVIIGEGHLKKKLTDVSVKYGIDKKISILPNTNNVLKFINKCRLFIQTSLWEGQPNVIIEAALLNKQIIVTKCPGQNKKILADFKNCHILSNNSVNNLTKKILFYLNRKKNKFTFHKNKHFKVEYSANIILDEIKKKN